MYTPRFNLWRKAILLTLGVLSITSTAQARHGGGIDSGGGDPFAAQFLQIARFIAVNQNGTHILGENIEPERVKAIVAGLETSLDGHSPRLAFPVGATVSCFGFPKLACTEEGRISVARDGWEKASVAEKVQVTAMELLVLLGEKGRYEIAPKVSAALAPRLVLGDGGLLFPGSTDRARDVALRMLNKPNNLARKQILATRAGNCYSDNSSVCTMADETARANVFQFTAEDISGVVFLGAGGGSTPCHFEKCEGEDYDFRDFLVIVKADAWTRNYANPAPLVFDLGFSRTTQQNDGTSKNQVSLKLYHNSVSKIPQR